MPVNGSATVFADPGFLFRGRVCGFGGGGNDEFVESADEFSYFLQRGSAAGR